MFRSVSNMIQSFSSFGFGKVYNYEILWAICGNQMNYINLYHHFLTIIIGNVTIYEMVIRRVVSSDEPSPKDTSKIFVEGAVGRLGWLRKKSGRLAESWVK